MTDANRIALLEAQVEVIARDRDDARQMLREMGAENARLRALSLPADEPRPTNWLDKRWESPEFRAAYGKASGEMAKWDEGYRAGVEAAARVAGQYATPPTDDSDYQRGWQRAAECAAKKISSLAPPSDSRDQGERVPPVSCRSCGEFQATRWVYSRHGVGYAVCGECDTTSITCPAPSPSADPEVTKP